VLTAEELAQDLRVSANEPFGLVTGEPVPEQKAGHAWWFPDGHIDSLLPARHS
jgi:hypothetical protein